MGAYRILWFSVVCAVTVAGVAAASLFLLLGVLVSLGVGAGVFGMLQRAVSPSERLAVLQTRAGLLDELAHRDPEGFTRWLNSGARAASDPARYLIGTLSRPHAPQQRRDSPRW